MDVPSRIRDSEIRAYLLQYAEKRGIRVAEHLSDNPGERLAFFCHLEAPGRCGLPKKTATAISYEGRDNALVMAFLNLSNPELDFIPAKA
jgi:hypothetical protein